MRIRFRLGAGIAAVAVGCGLLGPAGAAAVSADEGFGEDAWWYKAMNIAEAHETSTGKGVTIAVIDTPIDPTVPELRGQDVTAVRNFCGGSAMGTGPLASHGTTMVVNIVGSGRGTAPGGVGVAGIAPDATVRSYAIDMSAEVGAQCAVKSVAAARGEAIDAALDDGARIIAIATGTASPSEDASAVQRAVNAGAIVVAAAGNQPGDTSVIYPAAYPGAIAVAAVDRNAEPWKGNVRGNREAFVISAPGVDVTTGSFLNGEWTSQVAVTGTSEAAPLVAGGLALVAAEYPDATGNQLIQHLIHNPGGDDPFGHDLDYGYGIISVTKMLESDPATWPDENPLVGPDAAQETDGGAAGEVTAGGAPGTEAGETAPVAAATPDDGGGVPAWLLVAGVIAALVVVGAVVLGIVMANRRSGVAAAPGAATTPGWGGGGHG